MRNGCEKFNNGVKKKLSKKWKEYIINYDAQPGKNPTLFKAHKPDIPVRLLTTGC